MTEVHGFEACPPEQLWPCCDAAAYTAGERCTCWVVVTASPQLAIQEGPVFVRRRACEDCAYRMGSVERVRGEEPNPGNLPIYCHWDAAMVIRLVHPPSGVIIDVPPGEWYDPPQRGDRYWKADGRPGEYCAVWAAMNR